MGAREMGVADAQRRYANLTEALVVLTERGVQGAVVLALDDENQEVLFGYVADEGEYIAMEPPTAVQILLDYLRTLGSHLDEVSG